MEFISDPITGYLIGLVGVLFGLIALFQRWIRGRFQKAVAEAQGVFKKSDVRIKLYDDDDTETIIFALPLKDDHVFEMPLLINISNQGEKTSKDIELFIRFNKELIYGGLGELKLDGPNYKGAKFQTVSIEGPMITMALFLESLHPKQGINFQIPLSFRTGTILKHRVDALSSEGIPVGISYWVAFGMQFECFISQENMHPVYRKVLIKCLDIGSESAFKRLRRFGNALRMQYRERFRNQNLFKKLFSLRLNNRLGNKFYLVHSPSHEMLKDPTYKGRVYGPKEIDFFYGYQHEKGFVIPHLGLWQF